MRDPKYSTGLLIVDMQNDLVSPEGAERVPDSEKIITPIKSLIDRTYLFAHIFFTQQWHPFDHCSFRGHGGSHPIHCIAGSHGARIIHELDLAAKYYTILRKAFNPDIESYSPFEDATGTYISEPAEIIMSYDIEHLIVCGVALDRAIVETALSAIRAGFDITVVLDATAGIEKSLGACEEAVTDMIFGGATIVGSDDL